MKIINKIHLNISKIQQKIYRNLALNPIKNMNISNRKEYKINN